MPEKNPPYLQHQIACIVSCVLLCISASTYAGYKDDIGYTQLALDQGINIPDGSSIPVTQAEASTAGPDNPPVYLPDWNDSELLGKTITDMSGSTTGTFSSHATSVGKTFYGNTTSITPEINLVDAYLAGHWLQEGYLHFGSNTKPRISSSRIANHSWVGSADVAVSSDLLRRTDWVIARDEFIQCVGINNIASANQPLMSSAYNVIAVGKSDGLNGFGTAAIDVDYVSGRTRPELVAPRSTSSSATPVVAASATLLVDYGHANIGLSIDPIEVSTSNRNGDTIYNSERSEVIKAILMAGANRSTANTSAADISDYRIDTANQTANGLDVRYGAGQVNIFNSFHILEAGEQNSDEEGVGYTGNIDVLGFDYDPAFGGSNGSNTTASYYFTTGFEQRTLAATLAWNIKIDGGVGSLFNGSATLFDLDLHLYDVTSGAFLLLSSASEIDNTENIWTTVEPGRNYMLRVVPGSGQGDFEWDYALAWRLGTPQSDDSDADGILDVTDNCPIDSNPNQVDADGDGIGDACDPDRDGDGYSNGADNCPNIPNDDQTDTDRDSIGDVCDPLIDSDDDGVSDDVDNCLLIANANQSDTDGDHAGDACDPDDDNDGYTDVEEIAAGSDPLNSESIPFPWEIFMPAILHGGNAKQLAP